LVEKEKYRSSNDSTTDLMTVASSYSLAVRVTRWYHKSVSVMRRDEEDVASASKRKRRSGHAAYRKDVSLAFILWQY
jgi:hypothetical protein